MSNQLDLFQGRINRDKGIKQAEDHANNKHYNWSGIAFTLFEEYVNLQNRKEFMVEEFRKWAISNGLEQPPSNRAFGSVITKAVKNNLIERRGFRSVSNPKAHCTPASVWVKKF